jgi:hypothetical protein
MTLKTNQENMPNMFLTGFKILFDGHLMIAVNNYKILCDCHVTGRSILLKTPLITSHFLCDCYVTESQKSYLTAI